MEPSGYVRACDGIGLPLPFRTLNNEEAWPTGAVTPKQTKV
jgi:hypothetical protein